MSRWFQLERVGDYHSIAPSTGEELGETLARLAHQEMERFVANPNAKVIYWGDKVAQLFHLAADAYEAGAAVTIGHNRSDRYLEAANRHRSMAETLTGQSKLFRDQAQSSRLMVAFQDGYEGLKVDRYAFDDRGAFLIGKYFADQGIEIPERIKATRDGFDVDGVLYEVVYTSGKISEAFVQQKVI